MGRRGGRPLWPSVNWRADEPRHANLVPPAFLGLRRADEPRHANVVPPAGLAVLPHGLERGGGPPPWRDDVERVVADETAGGGAENVGSTDVPPRTAVWGVVLDAATGGMGAAVGRLRNAFSARPLTLTQS